MLVWITWILCRWIWHLVDTWVCFCSLVHLTDQLCIVSWPSWVLTSMFAGDILRVIHENLLVSFARWVLRAVPPGLLILCSRLLWRLSCSLDLMGLTLVALVILASEVLAGVNSIMQVSNWMKHTWVSPALTIPITSRILKLSTSTHILERLGIRANVLIKHTVFIWLILMRCGIARFQGAHSQYLKVILKYHMGTWALTYRLEGSGSQNAHSVLQQPLSTTCVLVVSGISDFIEFVICSWIGAILPLCLGSPCIRKLCRVLVKSRVLKAVIWSLM